MDNEQLNRILSGSVSYPILPLDYASVISDSLERESIQEFYNQLSSYLNFLGGQYPIVDELPLLYADPLKSISARARLTRAGSAQIIISRGIFDHLRELEFTAIVSGDLSFSLAGRELSRLAGFWILAHEYFHVARGHLTLPMEFYIQNPWGFEYDADCFATVALYRFVQANIARNSERRIRKSISLIPIYWCVRALVQAGSRIGSRSAHPEWEERLFYSTLKLISLDVPHPNFGDTPALLSEEEYMGGVTAQCEQIFCWERKLPQSTYFQWLENFVETRIMSDTAVHQWDAIAQLVIKNSRLVQDQQHYGPRIGRRTNVVFKLG